MTHWDALTLDVSNLTASDIAMMIRPDYRGLSTILSLMKPTVSTIALVRGWNGVNLNDYVKTDAPLQSDQIGLILRFHLFFNRNCE